jgi:hypothetical protein
MAPTRSGGGEGRDKRFKPRVTARSSWYSSLQTGHRLMCSSIATRAGNETRSSIYKESDRLISSHDIETPINNQAHADLNCAACGPVPQQILEWLANPGCSLFGKRSNFDKSKANPRRPVRATQRCCWPFSNTLSTCHFGYLLPAVSSLRPIWHRVS